MSGHQLYRHFNSAGDLLYVGISISAAARLNGHRTESEWFGQISKIKVEHFASRQEALLAEKRAIFLERPRHNRLHNEGSCAARKAQELADKAEEIARDMPLGWHGYMNGDEIARAEKMPTGHRARTLKRRAEVASNLHELALLDLEIDAIVSGEVAR